MSQLGKQLDFLSVFDQPEAVSGQNKDGNKSEQNPVEIQKQTERKQRLVRLLAPDFEARLEDFQEFLPEIEDYKMRMVNFRKEYDQAEAGEKKSQIYYKLVNPDINDEPQYRAIAALYLRYREALEKQRRLDLAKNKKSPQSGQFKKTNDKDSKASEGNSQSAKQKETETPKISPLVDDKIKGVSESYKDIYPMAR